MVERAKHPPTLLYTRRGLEAARVRIAADADARAWWQKFRRDVDARMLNPPETRGAQVPKSVNYAASGVAVLRQKRNYVLMDYGPHGGWHGHYDKLNLLVWGNGEMFAEDPGCVGYGTPVHWGWYRKSLAHNTLSVDGGQAAADGKLLAFSESAACPYVLAEAGSVAKGAWQAVWTLGSGAALVLVQHAPAGTLRTATGGAQPPSQSFRLAVNRVRGRTVRFATVLLLGEQAKTRAVELADVDEELGFRATIDGKTHVFRITSDWSSASVE